MAGAIRSKIGKESFERGHQFEGKVAEVYRLLHYDVELGRLFSGRQVDLFLHKDDGDLSIFRAIECKVGMVTADHIDAFIIKLNLVRREYPSALGSIISAVSFTDAVQSHATAVGIKLTLFSDLVSRLIDGRSYSTALIRECESNERYALQNYIEPMVGMKQQGEGVNAFTIIEEWLRDSEWNQLTLLGDVGTGKSFLSKVLAYRIAQDYLSNPVEKPFPVLIDLRNADREFSLEGLVITHLVNAGLTNVGFNVFQYVLSQGNLVLILDGFDEMAARITPQVTNRNFQQLARSVKGRAKVLLTCRTHYFKSRSDEEEVVLGLGDDLQSEAVKDLYWELVSRKGFKIAYLRPFSIPQIEEYVYLVKKESAKDALAKIRSTYNLMELSHRPMLLEMIVKSIDKLNTDDINATKLYEVFTKVWIHRDKWRDTMLPETKLDFLVNLARILWEEEECNIHYVELSRCLQHELKDKIENPQHFIELDNEIRTASFLTRDDSGRYGFAHKSYLEYFFAKYLAKRLQLEPIEALRTKRLTAEVIQFLFNMFDIQAFEPVLEGMLKEKYISMSSENAFIILYEKKRLDIIKNGIVGKDIREALGSIEMPTGLKLAGAKLHQAVFDGIVLVDVDLQDSVLTETSFSRASFVNANLGRANLTKAVLKEATFSLSDLQLSSLSDSNMEGCVLADTTIKGSNLTNCYLLKAKLINVDAKDVVSSGAVFPDELAHLFNRYHKKPKQTHQWDSILKLMPQIQKAAKTVQLVAWIEPDELISEVILQISAPGVLDKLSTYSKDKIYGYLKNTAYSVVKNLTKTAEVSFTQLADDLSADEIFTVPGEMRLESEVIDVYTQIALKTTDVNDHEKPCCYDDYNILELNNDIFTSAEHSPLEVVLLDEIKNLVSHDSWKIFEAYYINGQELKEIATSEGMPIRSVKVHLDKTFEIIQRHLLER